MADGQYIDSNAGDVAKQLDAALSRAPAAVTRAMVEVLRRDGEAWKGDMEESIHGPLVLGRGKARTSALATRRGQAGLKGSFFYSISGNTLSDLELRKFSTEDSAPLHEYGGTVRPKNRQWLAIPLPAAMTASGVPREPGPRDYGDLHFIPSKKSDQYAFLARVTTTVGRDRVVGYDDDGAPVTKASKGKPVIEYLFLLAKQITMPPRLGMNKTHRARETERLSDITALLVQHLQAAGDSSGSAAPA